MRVTLTDEEVAALQLQEPETVGDGGFQSLLVKLQAQLEPDTNELLLCDDDLVRIPKYAYGYGRGGWEDRLERIFLRTLGPGLKCNAQTA